jgi:hypothetical protein
LIQGIRYALYNPITLEGRRVSAAFQIMVD